MNLSITKEQIMVGLQAVQNVVSTRTTLPILSNVLLRAENGRLELTATDLDVTVACRVEATVKENGSTTVPVKKLFGIVRELHGEIEIESDGVRQTYRAGDFAYLRAGERQQFTVKNKVKHLYVCSPGNWKAGNRT